MELNYRKKLESCFILTLSILIVLLFAFQKFPSEYSVLPEMKYPEIVVVDIPRTIQLNVKRPPRPLQPSILLPVEEVDILDEIELDYEENIEVIPSDKIFLSDELEGLPYIPRQILEVLPGQGETNFQGKIVLSLWIDKKGKAKEHKVLSNTTGSEACLEQVLQAAYKSKWQPVVIDANIYEYWIEKTYIFD